MVRNESIKVVFAFVHALHVHGGCLRLDIRPPGLFMGWIRSIWFISGVWSAESSFRG